MNTEPFDIGEDTQTKILMLINQLLVIGDLNDLLNKIAEVVPQLVNGQFCNIYLVPELLEEGVYDGSLTVLDKKSGKETKINAEELLGKRFIVLAVDKRDGQNNNIGKHYYTEGEGLTGWVFKKRQALNIKDMGDKKELRKIDPDLRWSDRYLDSKKYVEKRPKPFLAIPLLSKNGKSLGVLRVPASVDRKPFLENAPKILSAFANIVSSLIERLNLIKYQENIINSFIDISRKDISRKKKDEFTKETFNKDLYSNITKIITQVLDWERCDLFIYDKFGENLEFKASTKTDFQSNECMDKSLENWSFNKGIPLFISNISKLERDNRNIFVTKKMILQEDIFSELSEDDLKTRYEKKHGCYINEIVKSLIVYPLRNIDDSIFGVLRISSFPKEEYDFKKEREQLDKVSLIISSLFSEIQQKELNSILEQLIKIQDNKQLFTAIISNLTKVIRGRGCSLFLVNKAEKVLKLHYTNSLVLKKHAVNEDKKEKDKIIQYRFGEGKTGLVARTGHLLVINHYGTSNADNRKIEKDYNSFKKEEQKNESLVEYLKDEKENNVGLILLLKIREKEVITVEHRNYFKGFSKDCTYTKSGLDSNKICETHVSDQNKKKPAFSKSFIAAALTVGGEVFGVIRIIRTTYGKIFSKEEINFMKLIVDRLCLQLESEKYLNAINEINKLIGKFVSLNKIYEAILQAATDILGFEFAAIHLADYEKNLIWAEVGRKNPNRIDAVDPNNWIIKKESRESISELVEKNKINVDNMKLYGIYHINPLVGQKQDIHAWLLEEYKDDIIIEGWHEHFKKDLYDRFGHKNLIRAFIRIISIDQNGEETKIGTLEAGHNIKRKSYISENELNMLKALGNLAAIAINMTKMNKEMAKLNEVKLLENTWKDIALYIPHKMTTSARTIQIRAGWLKEDIHKFPEGNNSVLNEHIETIQSSTDHILEFLYELRDYSNKPKALELELTNLKELLVDCKNNCIKGEIVTIDVAPDVSKIKLDREKFSAAVQECISNAVDFLPKEGGHIEIIATCKKTNTKDFVKINIKDNGIGVLPEHKEQIFNLLVAARENLPSKEDISSGVGLSFVKRDIEQHNGHIREIGKYGEGANFEIILPIIQ